MKVLVTGSDSFLAYHLISALLKGGCKVLGCDLKEGKNTHDLLQSQKDFVFHQCDISNFKQVEKIVKGIDCIYHLAAISSERLCCQEPIRSFEINVKGAINLLVANKDKKAAFIFISSGSVYPDSSKPKKEEEAGFSGKFYGTSKLVAEEYAHLFSKSSDFPLTILRFSRLYGPRMKRNPIYDMTKGLVAKDKILLYEGLESNYDFIYVKDVVQALVTAMDNKGRNNVFNISSSCGIKLKKLLTLYFKVVGFEVPVFVKREVSQADILDNSKALKFGFKLQTQLKEGLKETFLYFAGEA